jgi:hypothetical protein
MYPLDPGGLQISDWRLRRASSRIRLALVNTSRHFPYRPPNSLIARKLDVAKTSEASNRCCEGMHVHEREHAKIAQLDPCWPDSAHGELRVEHVYTTCVY